MAEEAVLDVPQQETGQEGPGNPIPLREEHRARLDGIVQQMIKNKESDETIKTVVADFKSKYADSTPKEVVAPEAPTPKVNGWDFKQVPLPDTEHQKQLDEAKGVIRDTWNNIGETAKDHLIYNQDNALAQQAQASGIDNTAVKMQLPPVLRQQEEKQRRDNIPQEDIEQLKNDPSQARQLLNLQNIKLQRQGKVAEAKALQASAYALDSQDRAVGGKEKDISKNIQDIKDGKLIYNPKTQDLVRPAGIFESISIGHENRNKSYEGGRNLATMSKEDGIKYLNNEIKDGDPDKPVPAPNSISSMIGSEGLMVAKGLVSAGAAGVASKNPVAAVAAYTGATSDEVALRAYHDEAVRTFKQVRNQLKANHPQMSDAEIDSMAYDKANHNGKVAAAIGAVTNAAMSVTGTRLGSELNKAAEAGLSSDVLKAADKVSNGYISKVAKSLPEAFANAGIAAGGEAVKNAESNRIGVERDPLENVAGAAGQMLLLHHVIAAGVHAVGAAKKTILQGLTTKSPEVIGKAVTDMVSDGSLTPEEGHVVLNEVTTHAAKDAVIPPTVTDPKARLEIQDKLDQFNENKAKLAKTEEGGLHESFHPEIKDKNDRIQWEINMLSAKPEDQVKILKEKQQELQSNIDDHNEAKQSGKPGKLDFPDADRAQLKSVKDKLEEVQAKVDSPIYKAAEIIKEGKIKGFSKDILEEAANNDPEKLKSYLKDISEQLHDPNSRETAIDTYGKKLSDQIEEMYPKAEPSRVSVSMPGENKSPDAITIKPNNGTKDAGLNQSEAPIGETNMSSESKALPSENTQTENNVLGEASEPPITPPTEQGETATSPQDPKTIGIAHEAQIGRLGKEAVERGEGVTAEEAVQHGRDLLDAGKDPQKAATDFKKDGKISYDSLSLVRAEHERLAKETNAAIDKFGEGSQEAKAAFTKEGQWLRSVVKPMQTEWSKIGTAQQGRVDVDTGSFMGMKRAFNEETGKDFTPKQAKEAKVLSDRVKSLTDEVESLKAKLTEQIDKNLGKKDTHLTIKEKAKQLAAKIRSGKLSRPDTFSAASPASLVWDGAIEVSAKTIEAAGTIAQAIADGLEHIKNSEWYKSLDSDKKKEAESAFSNHFKENIKNEDLFTRFVDKKDSIFTTDEVKAIWQHAKSEYLDQGTTYGDMLSGVSKDLGLSTKQVREAISQPKGAREITDEMYRVQQRRIDAVSEAKRWVKSNNAPKVVKFFKSLPSAFFGLKTFGHGTVGAITHAGMNIFQPTKWAHYFPFFIKQFKYAFGSTAEYAKAMEDLRNAPDFTFWKRAGLAVDPKEVYDEYQGASKMFGKLGVAGTRGFNALKVYRLDLAKSFYDHLSVVQKADPTTATEIAKLVNHSTGTTELRVPGVANTLLFAPKLELSRWQRLITDPAKAAKTFTSWGKASPGERAAAKIVARNAGEMLATYTAMLAANAGILAASGSKQKINFTDPLSSDWLKFKVGDQTIDVSGGMLATMRFASSILNEGRLAYVGNKKELKDKPGDKNSKAIATQLRYKLSPFSSTVVDLATGTDAMGRPLPFSKVKPKKGEEAYSVLGYLLHQQTPIPVSEGARAIAESMKEKGMSSAQVTDVLYGIMVGTVSGGTGAKVATDRTIEKPSEGHIRGSIHKSN